MSQWHWETTEQQQLFATFVMGAIVNASPNAGFFVGLVRNACDHGELDRLEHILRIKDDAVRGGLFGVLVGDMLARISLEGVRLYEKREGHKT